MAGTIIEKAIEIVTKVWREKLQKEWEQEHKEHMKIVKPLAKEIHEIIKEQVNLLEKPKDVRGRLEDLILQTTTKEDIDPQMMGMRLDNYFRDELKVPLMHWFHHNQTPEMATKLLDCKIVILQKLGKHTLEFLRTGHSNDWTEIIEFMKKLKHIKKIKEEHDE